MGDLREYSELSEDKTEPFSQSEIQARLERSRMEEFNAINSTVPLDKLVVPPDDDIRILMRPLVRDRSVREDRNVVPVALRAEEAEEEDDETPQQVLAVRQTARDISFTVSIPDYRNPDRRLACILYYDPASDNQILVNRSNVPFTLSRVSQEPEESRGAQYQVNPEFHKSLAPGTWRINMGGTDLLDFRLLERRPVRVRAASSATSNRPESSDVVNSAGKRLLISGEDDAGTPEKRRRSSSDAVGDKKEDSVIMFLPAKKPAGKGKELMAPTGHPLLDLQSGETLEVPRGPGLVGYTVTKKDQIASTTLSSVFTAEYSGAPGRYVVAKVLKTTLPASANASEGALAKTVIRQAQTWLRELENQEKLKHKNIVHLYGGDARYLSLYMEAVDGRDLSARGVWRTSGTDLFSGNRSDAMRILRDISHALHYLHGLRLEHNDIKPGNILYTRERGAVVCDMGLSSERGSTTGGGTPWYVPPEYIGLRHRGPPSDVWALGVVMLYVIGKISWPDIRANEGHPRHLYWKIADVNEKAPQPQVAAVSRMRTWLGEVNAVRNGLNVHDKLEQLVHGMLSPNPKERLTTKTIVNQLFAEQAGGDVI
ncbi:kinase-like domain-containing protein [Chaetomidium leptoderma]|uniref:Kinase-like domain-containing protein n=1 Tax=Chaetomidium leptoderma TaxID=669021 RepID=A0AAN6VHH3_9PEZI|nr:kinase-like domain-containing protein [Chaetomidium leptoderma]